MYLAQVFCQRTLFPAASDRLDQILIRIILSRFFTKKFAPVTFSKDY